MVLFDFIAGLLLLLAGRQLFWVCVGVVGFLIGVQAASALGYSDQGTTLLLALALGCLGALLAIAFEWFMIVFGVGFLAGGYLAMNLFPSNTLEASYTWLIFVVGGILGICLMVMIFDWALIIMSSLLGATLLIHVFHGTTQFLDLLFLGCFVVGMLVQYFSWRGQAVEQRPARTS